MGVVGIASFALQTFQGCVQALPLVERAQHIRHDGDVFRTGLSWEQYRLMQWGQRAGLLEKPPPMLLSTGTSPRCFLSRSRGS